MQLTQPAEFVTTIADSIDTIPATVVFIGHAANCFLALSSGERSLLERGSKPALSMERCVKKGSAAGWARRLHGEDTATPRIRASQPAKCGLVRA